MICLDGMNLANESLPEIIEGQNRSEEVLIYWRDPWDEEGVDLARLYNSEDGERQYWKGLQVWCMQDVVAWVKPSVEMLNPEFWLKRNLHEQ